jgi:multiple sugar transport system substrate-binding protein
MVRRKVNNKLWDEQLSKPGAKPISRRAAISKLTAVSAGLGVAVVAAGVGGYFAGSLTAAPATVTKTQTVTVTATAPTPPVTPSPIKKFTISFPGAPGGAHHIHLSRSFEILKKKYPTLELEFIAKEWGVYYEWLLTSFGAGEPPDAPLIDCIWMPKFVELGFLEPLDDYVAKWPDYEQWIETFKEGMIFDGHIYGIWGNTDVRPFWYWKEYFPEGFPKTFEELLDKGREIGEKGYPKIAIPVLATIYPWYIIYASIAPEERMKSPGWGLFDVKNGKWIPIFHDEYGVKALEMMLKMKEVGGFYFHGVGEWPANHDAFAEKKFSAFLVGNWLTVNILAKGYKYEDFPKYLGISPFPPPKGGRVHAGIPGGWVHVIPKAAKAPKELIWEYITTTLDKELVGTTLAEVGLLPTRKDAWPILIEKSPNPFTKDFVEMFKNVYIRPEMTEWERVSKILDDMQWAVLLGKQSPKEAAKEAADKISLILG